MQIVLWFWCLFLFTKDQLDADGDPDAYQLDIFPLLLALIGVLSRQFILAVRAGTTPTKLFLKQSQ